MAAPNIRVADIRKILDEVAKANTEASRKQLNFTGVDEGTLIRKLSRVDSPMIIFQSWSGSASPGGAITYNVGVHNPDPNPWIWLYAYAFVGPANFVRSIGEAVDARDRRYADLSMPSFPGQQIAPGATETLAFTMPIPMTVERTTYQGNTVLFQADWHDVGLYLDRGYWSFDVV